MDHEFLPHVVIFTDGACRPNPGIGGWAALLRFGAHEKILSGTDIDTTSNRMELHAAVSALSALKQRCFVEVYVDSTYLRKGITEWIPHWRARNWKTSEGNLVKNIDLWQALERVTHAHEVHWYWIKGHAGHPDNEKVNALARRALDCIQGEQLDQELLLSDCNG